MLNATDGKTGLARNFGSDYSWQRLMFTAASPIIVLPGACPTRRENHVACRIRLLKPKPARNVAINAYTTGGIAVRSLCCLIAVHLTVLVLCCDA